MSRSFLLTFDGVVNLLLGTLLLFFPANLVATLGLPEAQSAFYPSILGGVLLGIGVALLWDRFRGGYSFRGLGVGGAISINLCGGLVLVGWLVRGNLDLPLQGTMVLWTLVLLLVGLSIAELASERKEGQGAP